MTVTTTSGTPGGGPATPPEDLVTLTIDGIEISVPKRTLVIRAAELLVEHLGLAVEEVLDVAAQIGEGIGHFCSPGVVMSSSQ